MVTKDKCTRAGTWSQTWQSSGVMQNTLTISAFCLYFSSLSLLTFHLCRPALLLLWTCGQWGHKTARFPSPQFQGHYSLNLISKQEGKNVSAWFSQVFAFEPIIGTENVDFEEEESSLSEKGVWCELGRLSPRGFLWLSTSCLNFSFHDF